MEYLTEKDIRENNNFKGDVEILPEIATKGDIYHIDGDYVIRMMDDKWYKIDVFVTNRVICGDAEQVMKEQIKNESVHLIITSPPYNLGMDYHNHNDSKDYNFYLDDLYKVWKECYRVLVDGGRICINIPNITLEKKYYSLTSDIVKQMEKIGFIMRGDILWYKQVCSNRTAWGSWQSPSNPNII
ncbi:MAG: site-specific DNA-methyltransferase, partial [Firmicutes bacterium]|nr:site-specific DNA-methyltransferase [Bacillota bacterium]